MLAVFRLVPALMLIRGAACKRVHMPENAFLSTWSDTMHSALTQEGQAAPLPNNAETSLTIVATVNKSPQDQAAPVHRPSVRDLRPARVNAGVAYPVNIEFRESPYYADLRLESEDESAMGRNKRRELIEQVLLEAISQKNKSDGQGHREHRNDRNLAVSHVSGAAILLTVCVLLAF